LLLRTIARKRSPAFEVKNRVHPAAKILVTPIISDSLTFYL